MCHIMACVTASHKTALSAKLVVGLYDCSMSKRINTALNVHKNIAQGDLLKVLEKLTFFFLFFGCSWLYKNQLLTLVRLHFNQFFWLLFETQPM